MELVIPAAFLLILMAASVQAARRKGFAIAPWILGSSAFLGIGLFVLYCLPAASVAGLNEEQQDRRRRAAYIVGGILTTLTVAGILALLLLNSRQS